MKIIIDGEEWILNPIRTSQKVVKSPSGKKHIYLDAILLKPKEDL